MLQLTLGQSSRRKIMWKAVLCTVVSMALATGAIMGCNKGPAAGAAPPGGMPKSVVTTAPVAVADVPIYLEEIGRTSATEVVTIQPQVSGRIIERDFTDGSDLTKGEKLFAIDPRPFEAALHAAQAQL